MANRKVTTLYPYPPSMASGFAMHRITIAIYARVTRSRARKTITQPQPETWLHRATVQLRPHHPTLSAYHLLLPVPV